jgi:hypothetical protein
MKEIDSINDGIARFDPAQSLALLASCIGVPSFPATSSAQRSAHSCSGARAVSKSLYWLLGLSVLKIASLG